MTTRILTGITPTGTPHLGNYAGAIRPAILASRRSDVDSFYFLADYHALIKCDDPARIQRSRLEIAATWLAGGLDVERATFYRQSDIPEIPELTWLLTCVSAKGLLNRAHAYKAAVDRNVEAGEDPDAGVTMGLYSYPVLMAADILMFNAHKIPVGRDQVQHVEMARDIGQRFNHLFGNGREFFVLPEAVIEENVATLPGLDGRKMSKSYDNTIPLFSPSRQLKDAIARIVTDSRAPGEPKDPDSSHLFLLYSAFASAEQVAAFRQELLDGLAWGEAKQRLFQLLDNELGEARERYQALIAKPDDIEDILLAGAAKARRIATPFIAELREAVGLRSLREPLKSPESGKKKVAKAARLVSFRDDDGSFRFRLLDAAGEQLLLSRAFADGKAAGAVSKRLLAGETADLRAEGNAFGLWLDGEAVAQSPAFADAAARDAAIERTREALARVGRGKTYLVDTFFESLPFEQKVRTHFHRFMKRVHEELKTLKGEKNPLTIIGKRFADEARVICFDEFFVSDITDAMILATLLEELFKNGVSLVATSNIVPDGLYKDGLQRARFLPAIALLKEHTEIVNVDSGVDYRLRALEQAELFHWPLSEQVEEEMARSFKALTPDCAKAQRDEALMIENREIRARLTCDDVAWFEFRELCDGPRSQNDYIELAKIFHAVLISNVEQMGVTKDDMARRFINLVDEFYDRSVKLIISAEVELKDLYSGGRLEFEFQRTLSRLLEMQSHEYLTRPHRP